MENEVIAESFPASLSSPAADGMEEPIAPHAEEGFKSPPYAPPPGRNSSRFPGEECNRVCVPGERRTCFFDFTLEHYQAMGVACGNCARGKLADCEHPQCVLGDGVEKGVMSINRRVPGPPIQVCKGDVVVVDVHNMAGGTTAALHWHGLFMKETSFMDGVPFVTQCPIPFATTFRYAFRATESGTNFYHSHSGHHKVNGQYGALIIREPPSHDSNSATYDYDFPEHHIIISDWMHTYAEDFMPGNPSTTIAPKAVVINGRGTFTDTATKKRTFVPPTKYYVSPGKRYRFRMINAGNHACPFLLQIDNHNLTVIASDSNSLSPKVFDSIVSNAGERYDFVLTADQLSGDFWIRVKAIGVCRKMGIESFALLRYVDNERPWPYEQVEPPLPPLDQTLPDGISLNHPDANCGDTDQYHCITAMNSTEQDDELRLKEPDHKLFLSLVNFRVPSEEVFHPGRYQRFVNVNGNITIASAINKLTLALPSSPPLTQPEDVPETDYCHFSKRPERCKGLLQCSCVHRLKIRTNSIVEVIILDGGGNAGIHHPVHIHGHRFMVTGIGRLPEKPFDIQLVKEMERLRMLPRLPMSQRPPFKDTVSIPSRGYAVIRLRATNPGFWMMHCHYEWHMVNGMALIVQVGDQHEMVPAPKEFPKCGNYLPEVHL